MGKNTYDKCLELMAKLKQMGFEVEIPVDTVVLQIQTLMGGDVRTVSNYLGLLRRYGFLAKPNDNVFKITKRG